MNRYFFNECRWRPMAASHFMGIGLMIVETVCEFY